MVEYLKSGKNFFGKLPFPFLILFNLGKKKNMIAKKTAWLLWK